MPTELERFTELFNKPSWQAMHDNLTPREFENFVAYVLRRAGYDARVVGLRFLRGVDIEVRLPGQTRIIAGIECKRYVSSQLVNAHIVQHVKGASAVSRGDAKPFVITTSGFNDEAYQMANEGRKHAYLIDGSQLVRYINYIRGSRRNDDDIITSLPPEFFAGKGAVHSHADDSSKILTVANNKGGVGKTMTAYYLGVALARQGKRVLLIDLDGQANLTERCFPEQLSDYNDTIEHFPNIAQYFAHQQMLSNLIIATGQEHLSIIPSDPNLTLRDLGGSGRPDVELRFVTDVRQLSMQPIASLGGTPDWIIIDTPPAMSVFTRAGLAAAHYVLAPLRPRRASFNGTRNMLLTLRTMDALTGTSGRFLGTLLTHWDTLEASKRFEAIDLPRLLLYLQEFGGQAFQAKIPIDNQLETLQPGAKTRGAEAYEALASELLRRVQSGPNGEVPIGTTNHDNARKG